jgi:hypothetical protein
MKNERQRLKKLLEAALLDEGEMDDGLYEYDLEEHIEYFYAGLRKDQEEFVFAINENTGHVAMVLMTPDKSLYINEEARKKLQEIWPQTYKVNMKRLNPIMVRDLLSGHIAVNGVRTIGSK